MKTVVISDTHNLHKNLNLPEADLIIHSGDFSHNEWQCSFFVEWYASLPIPNKILVAGNHDHHVKKLGKETMIRLCENLGIHYLENSVCEIQGIKFWGSPYSGRFGNYPFMEEEMELSEIWEEIPSDTQIVITHGPAYGIGDLVNNNWVPNRDKHVGSKSLTRKLSELKDLKYHITGHIHESYGIYSGTNYTTVNASILNKDKLNNVNDPILIDI